MSATQLEGAVRAVVGGLHRCRYPLPVAADALYAGDPAALLAMLDWALVHYSPHVSAAFAGSLERGRPPSSLDDVAFAWAALRFLRDALGVRPPLQAAQLLARPGAFAYRKLSAVDAVLRGALAMHAAGEASASASARGRRGGAAAARAAAAHAASFEDLPSEVAAAPPAAPPPAGEWEGTPQPMPRSPAARAGVGASRLPPLPRMPWESAAGVAGAGAADARGDASLRRGSAGAADTQAGAAAAAAAAPAAGAAAAPPLTAGLGGTAPLDDDIGALLSRLAQRFRATDELVARASAAVRRSGGAGQHAAPPRPGWDAPPTPAVVGSLRAA